MVSVRWPNSVCIFCPEKTAWSLPGFFWLDSFYCLDFFMTFRMLSVDCRSGQIMMRQSCLGRPVRSLGVHRFTGSLWRSISHKFPMISQVPLPGHLYNAWIIEQLSKMCYGASLLLRFKLLFSERDWSGSPERARSMQVIRLASVDQKNSEIIRAGLS